MQAWVRELRTAAVVAVLVALPTLAQTVASGKRAILTQSTASWNGKPYEHYPEGKPELTVLKLTVAPNTALPWHTHPYPNAGYVLSGELTIQDKVSGKQQTFHAGQAFTESVDDAHRGVAGKQPTVVILTYAGVQGKPLSVPLPGEKAEY